MENKHILRRIHPLVAGAAVSVMLVSLTGVAAMLGLLPNSHGTTATAPVASSIGVAAAASSPAALVEAKGDEGAAAATPSHPVPAKTAPDVQAPAGATLHPTSAGIAAICSSCGQVESVHALEHTAKPSGVGVVAGAVVGGLLGNHIGGGNGRTLATVAGAVGGGYAGNEVEKRTHTTVSYQVRVRMEDGHVRSFSYAQQPGWNIGDRVRVVHGHLTARA